MYVRTYEGLLIFDFIMNGAANPLLLTSTGQGSLVPTFVGQEGDVREDKDPGLLSMEISSGG